MQQQCVKAIVKGKVQGVFYRASTREQAEQLGLVGYAHNKPDGSVEVVACGSADAIEKLLAWMEEGPPDARVDHIEATEMCYKAFQEFSIG